MLDVPRDEEAAVFLLPLIAAGDTDGCGRTTGFAKIAEADGDPIRKYGGTEAPDSDSRQQYSSSHYPCPHCQGHIIHTTLHPMHSNSCAA